VIDAIEFGLDDARILALVVQWWPMVTERQSGGISDTQGGNLHAYVDLQSFDRELYVGRTNRDFR
jgi:hypothetical protein